MTYFLGVMLGTMLDPISALGYVLAGVFARRLWIAVAIAVVWRTVLFMMLGGPSKAFLPILAGAVLFTVIVFFIRTALRKNQTSTEVSSSGQL